MSSPIPHSPLLADFEENIQQLAASLPPPDIWDARLPTLYLQRAESGILSLHQADNEAVGRDEPGAKEESGLVKSSKKDKEKASKADEKQKPSIFKRILAPIVS
jgi:hypothetical protein